MVVVIEVKEGRIAQFFSCNYRWRLSKNDVVTVVVVVVDDFKPLASKK